MKLRGIIFTIISILIFLGSANAIEEIPKIAVIDRNAVAQKYFKQSKSYRELEKLNESYQEKIDEINTEISKLEDQRLRLVEQKLKKSETSNSSDTFESEDDNKTSRIDKMILRKEQEIFERKNYLSDYTRIKRQEIDKRYKNLTYSDNFFDNLQAAIARIAAVNGYSLVLDKNNRSVMVYWVPEIDITDKVLAELIDKD